MTYQFRPLTPDDKEMFCDWLSNAHINGWWADGETEWALLEEDWAMGDNRTDMRIVEWDGQPFAYIQDYNAHVWDMPHYKSLPQDARGIDTFLGDPKFLGQGHGAGYLNARMAELFDTRISEIAVDPSPENTRAIASYKRAGFIPRRVLPCEDGTPSLLMTCTENEFVKATLVGKTAP